MRQNPKEEHYFRNCKSMLIKKEYHTKAMEFAKKFNIPMTQLFYILLDIFENLMASDFEKNLASGELLAKLQDTGFKYRKREFKNNAWKVT